MNDPVRYPISFYLEALDNYVCTGECADMDEREPLYDYLLSLMNDPIVKLQVLSSEICARIFYDTMLNFIELNLKQQKYNLQRSQSELETMTLTLDWTPLRRRDGWQALIQKVGDTYQEYGFDRIFYQGEFSQEEGYENDDTWTRMVDDWESAFRRKQMEQRQQSIDSRKETIERRLRNNLKNIPEFLKKNNIPDDEFFQAWGLMSGMWNTADFNRIRQIVRLQRDYPILEKVANVMGRIANDDGKDHVHVSGGNTYRLERASRSDIEGVTIGNDLNALLPIELVHCTDDVLQELFVYKYLTRKLQTFRYKSEILNPSNRLEKKDAKPKGPMIVCLDTSGSMVGTPEKIANSLMCKLLELADKQRRDLFLIAFSISVNPIDIKKDRARLLEFFSHTVCGDTDATRMLEHTFQLLHSSPSYQTADILWISDFRIPPVSTALTDQMLKYKKDGIHFYGLQIGIAEHEWHSHFERIYSIGYTPSRKH